MKKAFTIIELLVVTGIISLLASIIVPVLARVRTTARVLVVNMELRDIGLALDMYTRNNKLENDGDNQNYPPTRADCWDRDNMYQLPKELVECGYLPKPSTQGWVSTGIEDRFNKGRTYKYQAVGDIIKNFGQVQKNKSWLIVPPKFPAFEGEPETDKIYFDPEKSPVKWAIYSLGPNFDHVEMGNLHYPVPRRSWYDESKQKGVIVRMKLKNGSQIGTFTEN